MKKAFKRAFPRTIPVLSGYVVLGIAFGLSLKQAGYNYLWAFAISLFVYAGSMQFVLVGLLSSGASLLTAAVTTLLVNSRHIFYGLSFLTRFRNQGKRKPYMIMSLTDETYSLLCASDCPDGIKQNDFDFAVSALDHSYWVLGSVIGSLIGQFIHIDFSGVEFSMTALFVVILVEQVRSASGRIPALIGFLSASIFLMMLGAQNFLLPSLIITVIVVLACQKPITAWGGDRA